MATTPDRKSVDEAFVKQSQNGLQRPAVRPHIRWMIRRDMPEVLDIEQQSFEFPWEEDDFIRCLRQRNCIGMVAEGIVGETTANTFNPLVGFFLYELHKTRLDLLNFAVHPDYRRAGVGRAMLERMMRKLSAHRRMRIVTEVRETNVPAQVFLRSLGFRAISVLRDFYDDTTESAYLFQYRYVPAATSDGFEQAVAKHPERFKGYLHREGGA